PSWCPTLTLVKSSTRPLCNSRGVRLPGSLCEHGAQRAQSLHDANRKAGAQERWRSSQCSGDKEQSAYFGYVLYDPVLAIMTRRRPPSSSAGEVVVGLAFDHRVADAFSTSMFLVAWAECAWPKPISAAPCSTPRRPARYRPSLISKLYTTLSSLPPPVRIQDLANKRTKLKTFTAFPWQTVAKVTGNGSGRRRACQDERVGGWAPATEHAGHGDLLRQRRDSHLREPKNRGSHVDGRVGRGGGGRARDDKGGGHAGALVGVHRFLVEEQQPEAVRSKILPGGRGRRGGGEGVVGDEVSSGGSGFRVEKAGVGVVPLLVEVNVGCRVTPTPSVEEKGTGWCTRG
ncbi:hypothetical protein GW17_00036606, partial [Ensete ventricosum]